MEMLLTVSHRYFFSSDQTVFALQLKMQSPSISPTRVPSGGCVPCVFDTCSPYTLTCCGIQGEGHQYLDSSDPLLQHKAGIVGDTGSCIDGVSGLASASPGFYLPLCFITHSPLLIFTTPNPAAEMCRKGFGGGQTFLGDGGRCLLPLLHFAFHRQH